MRLLAILITILALADGLLHVGLDFILFRGNLFGSVGPPPGAPAPPTGGGGPPQFPLPLNQLFVLALVGYVVLVLLLWFVTPRLGGWGWLVEALFIIYAALLIVAWMRFGAPNPRNLGYISKTMEILIILAVLGHFWARVGRAARVRSAATT